MLIISKKEKQEKEKAYSANGMTMFILELRDSHIDYVNVIARDKDKNL